MKLCCVVLGCISIGISLSASAHAGIIDLSQWTLVQDPAHPQLTSSIDSTTQITLKATGGPISNGTDIGYQSVNGYNVGSSTSGWAFDPGFNFSVALDFNLTFGTPMGGFTIGMGIGEDRDGTDSAGVVLTSQNGMLLSFLGAARVNDVTQTPILVSVPGQTTGRFIVSYDAATGNVTVGVSTNGDDLPEGSVVFNNIQNSWDNERLFVSFFARGDNGVFGWTSGTANAVFSDLHVISGAPTSIVPEPSTLLMLGLGAIVLIVHGRKRQTTSPSLVCTTPAFVDRRSQGLV